MGKTGQLIVKPDNPRPVGRLGAQGSRVAGGDRRLQRIQSACAAELFGTLESRKAPADQQVIPQRTILIEKENRLA